MFKHVLFQQCSFFILGEGFATNNPPQSVRHVFVRLSLGEGRRPVHSGLLDYSKFGQIELFACVVCDIVGSGGMD